MPGNGDWLTALPLLSETQRREVESVFRRALVESPLPTVLTSSVEGRVLGVNAQFEQLMGVDEAQIHGQRVAEELVHPDDRDTSRAVLERLHSRQSRLESYEARWIRPDGGVVWTRRHVLRVDGPSEDDEGYLVGVLEDLTPLRVSERVARGLIEIGTGIAAGASLTETARRLAGLAEARWNRAGCVLTVLDRERNVLVPVPYDGPNARILAEFPLVPPGPAGGACGMAAWRDEPVAAPDLAIDPRVAHVQPLFAKHGVVSAWSVPLHDAEGQVIGTLGIFHPYRFEPTAADWDALASVAGVAAIAVVADKRRLSHQHEQQRVRTDPRTGLLNDVGLIEHIDAMLARNERISVAVATLRGPGRLASHDAVARMALNTLAARGGALGQVPHVAATGVTSLAFVARAEWGEREARLLHRVLSRPIDLGTAVIRPEVAVGVAVSAAQSGNAAELLARATLAVPSRGGSRLVAPDPVDTDAEHGLVADVTRAFRASEFVPHYQPRFDLMTGDALGSEALVRWNHPSRGVLAPASFLPIIECTGASTELAFMMVRQVAADRDRRLELGLPGKVAINVAAEDLLNESFLQALRDPDRQLWRQVELELTEAQFVRPDAVSALEELAALGFSLALDDFGTGYSALSAIHTLPVSTVKIDQSFVARLPHDASAEALIAAISALCDQLEIAVVAEGIETEEQARAVRDLGCRIGQGYLFGRPQPLEAFTPDALRRRDHVRRTKRVTGAIADAARRRLVELHRQGSSPTSIAAALNRSGYRAPGGTRWHARSVHAFLDDEEQLPPARG